MKKLLYALVILATLYGSAQATNLSDIRTQVRRSVRDTDTTNPRYSDSILNSFINEAQNTANNAGWLCRGVTSYALTPNVTYYALPTDFLAASQVYFKRPDATTIVLLEQPQAALYQLIPDWDRRTGTPNYYYVSQPTSAVVGSSSTMLISFIQVPTSISTGVVTIWYVQDIPNMNADSDLPFGGRMFFQPYSEALYYYAASRILALDGIYDESNYYMALFKQDLAVMVDRANQMPNYFPKWGAGNGK